MRVSFRRAVLHVALSSIALLAAACRETGRVDAATLHHSVTGPELRVTVLGRASDERIPFVREAIAYWNEQFRRLDRQVRLDSAIVRERVVSDEALRAGVAEAVFGGGPATARLRQQVASVPGDIIIMLSDTDLISYSVQWRADRAGLVVMRRSDIPPLSLPNTVRNVVAHEVGHVLGLEHNADATTLMCGRPASCRPAAFASDTAHFFPLTSADDARIRNRWP